MVSSDIWLPYHTYMIICIKNANQQNEDKGNKKNINIETYENISSNIYKLVAYAAALLPAITK